MSTPGVGAGLGPRVDDKLITNWDPARLLCKETRHTSGYALLILNQPLDDITLLKVVWEKADFRIAADGGANRLEEMLKDPSFASLVAKIGLEVICGDLDSLDPAVEASAAHRGTKIHKDPDQYSTDFTKCVTYIQSSDLFRHSPTPLDIVCLGGLGGRVDQGMSTLHHLYKFQNAEGYTNGRIYLLSTEAMTFVLKSGYHRIRVRDPGCLVLGKHIGIIPIKEPSTITTKGLEWDVENWYTEFGGDISTSNLVREDFVEIFTEKDVLFTIDLSVPSAS